LRHPTPTLALLISCLLLTAALAAAAPPAFVLTDPARDDHGDGTLKYPLVAELREGDLDLVELAAEPAADGTWFVATMRRNIRPPGGRIVDATGTTEAQSARLGFYAFNIDIYIDIDRVPGSGRTSTLPGRKLTVAPETAWERAVILSPRPELSALVVRQELARRAKAAVREEKPRVDDSDLAAARQEAREALESDFWFARSVQVTGRRVKFFVPNSFLGGPARADWAYAVVVTGASLESRFDTTTLIGKAGVADNYLLVPVGSGLSAEHFAGREDDPLQPPVVDLIVPAGQSQEAVLGDYDVRTGRMAQITGVVPGP